VIQPQTQTSRYWVSTFNVSSADIEQLYNHFLEVEQPQTIFDLARVVMSHRVTEERSEIRRRLAGRTIYRPKDSFQVGQELVFPSLKFAFGAVISTREGFNPQYGAFQVITVEVGGKEREFAAELQGEHALNQDDGQAMEEIEEVPIEDLVELFGPAVADKIAAALKGNPEFIRLGQQWFVRGLMAETNVGHLHLAEAVLEVNDGGPLPVDQIIEHLDLEPSLDPDVKRFSLNYAMLNDGRFDEVAPPGRVAWFLRRMEPQAVQEPPERLRYSPVAYDKALLTQPLTTLEQELDDEWSDFEPPTAAHPTLLTLTYPHRAAGSLPLSSRVRPLFPTGISERQRVVLVDDHSNEEIVAWVVREQRYIYGLGPWYEREGIPVGGFVSLRPGPDTGVVLLGYDRRRPQREWVRLATVEDNRLKFGLAHRTIGCGYDDLMIVATEYGAAVDALFRRVATNARPIASLLAEIFPELAGLNPQGTVHAKTLYSAINMLRRVPPGPLFAELARHPAFQSVGDHYWQFDSRRM
jgi:hypothetical protein